MMATTTSTLQVHQHRETEAKREQLTRGEEQRMQSMGKHRETEAMGMVLTRGEGLRKLAL